MKKYLWIILIGFFLMTWGCVHAASWQGNGNFSDPGSTHGYETDRGEMDMDYIYNYLEPHGNWIEMAPYGYVWTPRNMGYRWRPYNDGQWVSTDYGWSWISHEEWGSIPFHYGRWGHDNDFGWYWVPGTVWGPAWVSWRWSEQYVGWAPLPPGVDFRVGHGYVSLSFKIPNRFWVFVQSPYFMERDVYRHTLPYERNRTIINFTSLHHNIRYNNDRIFNAGVTLSFVQRVTRHKVQHYTVHNDREHRHGRVQGNNVTFFQSNFRHSTSAKPKTFMNRDDARHKLNSTKIFEPRNTQQIDRERKNAQKRQALEKKMLKKTQAQEVKYIRNKRSRELTKIKDRAEKDRISQANNRKMENLKKQHQAEIQRLDRRNKQDFEHIKKIAKQRQQNSRQSEKNEKKQKNKKNKKK